MISKTVLCKGTNQLIDKCIAFPVHTHWSATRKQYDGMETAGKKMFSFVFINTINLFSVFLEN